MDEYLQAIADRAHEGLVGIRDLKTWFGDEYKAKNALRRLGREGLVFPIARGKYALPQRERFVDAIAIRSPSLRRGVWLQPWLSNPDNRRHLPDGLAWQRASFLDLAVDRHTELVWEGPLMVVPLESGTRRIGAVYHKTPAFLLDPNGEPEVLEIDGQRVRTPSRMETSRILGLHLNPRLREAASNITLPGSEQERLRFLKARTDAIQPFPASRSGLPRGPPFRYRIFAPRSWVLKDHAFARVVTERGL